MTVFPHSLANTKLKFITFAKSSSGEIAHCFLFINDYHKHLFINLFSLCFFMKMLFINFVLFLSGCLSFHIKSSLYARETSHLPVILIENMVRAYMFNHMGLGFITIL